MFLVVYFQVFFHTELVKHIMVPEDYSTSNLFRSGSCGTGLSVCGVVCLSVRSIAKVLIRPRIPFIGCRSARTGSLTTAIHCTHPYPRHMDQTAQPKQVATRRALPSPSNPCARVMPTVRTTAATPRGAKASTCAQATTNY